MLALDLEAVYGFSEAVLGVALPLSIRRKEASMSVHLSSRAGILLSPVSNRVESSTLRY